MSGTLQSQTFELAKVGRRSNPLYLPAEILDMINKQLVAPAARSVARFMRRIFHELNVVQDDGLDDPANKFRRIRLNQYRRPPKRRRLAF